MLPRDSVRVFKKDGILIGHIPVELSQLIDYFMKKNKEKFVSALVVRPRKHKVRLLVPAKFTAVTKKLTVLSFELSFVESKIVKQPISLNIF